MTTFDGFSKAGMSFLAKLGENDKAWLDANRATYDTEVVPAAKAFVVTMGDYLRANISDAIEAQPKTNGSIAPINNDLRFSPDVSPYKDHLMFRFWEGPVKKTSAMLMVRVHPTDGVGFASSMNFANVDTWRAAVDSEETGAPLVAAIDSVVADTKADVVGEGLKKPFDQDLHELICCDIRSLQVRFSKKPPGRAPQKHLRRRLRRATAATARRYPSLVPRQTTFASFRRTGSPLASLPNLNRGPTLPSIRRLVPKILPRRRHPEPCQTRHWLVANLT